MLIDEWLDGNNRIQMIVRKFAVKAKLGLTLPLLEKRFTTTRQEISFEAASQLMRINIVVGKGTQQEDTS